MKRNTIKNHSDFAAGENDPTGKSTFFLVRAKPAKFPDDPRYGLIVTKKSFRFAVSRNRAKRMLRDWIAYNERLLLPGFDYIFVARSAILDASRNQGRTAMYKALAYIKHIAKPKNHNNEK